MSRGRACKRVTHTRHCHCQLRVQLCLGASPVTGTQAGDSTANPAPSPPHRLSQLSLLPLIPSTGQTPPYSFWGKSLPPGPAEKEEPKMPPRANQGTASCCLLQAQSQWERTWMLSPGHAGIFPPARRSFPGVSVTLPRAVTTSGCLLLPSCPRCPQCHLPPSLLPRQLHLPGRGLGSLALPCSSRRSCSLKINKSQLVNGFLALGTGEKAPGGAL